MNSQAVFHIRLNQVTFTTHKVAGLTAVSISAVYDYTFYH